MKRSLLALFITCALLSACSGHQPAGYYGSPFIVKKQSSEKKDKQHDSTVKKNDNVDETYDETSDETYE